MPEPMGGVSASVLARRAASSGSTVIRTPVAEADSASVRV